MLRWETVTPYMRQALQTLASSTLRPRFYLAGGTALALQLGHRRSVDLDLFSATDEVRPGTHREALVALAPFRPAIVVQRWGNLLKPDRRMEPAWTPPLACGAHRATSSAVFSMTASNMLSP
jgi:hypothetical protein